MPRIKRLINKGEKTVYHVISRTALDGLPFGVAEKEEFVNIMRKFSRIYFVKVLGYCVMGNHFHMLIMMLTGHHFSDDEIKHRFWLLYGDEREFMKTDIEFYREKWSNLSEYMKDIKQTFSRFYNKLHDRRGTLWGERFKSVIVEKGQALINCLAYIDLNPVRAGIVTRPEDYRWCSLSYHVQTGNRDGFLSTDFGLREFNVVDKLECLRRYRRYVYESGALEKKDREFSGTIDKDILEQERSRGFDLNRVQRFRYRTRYFTDSGIIGSKTFVMKHYQQFKDYFQCRNEKKPKSVKGIEGIYSLKRLSESL